jgi:hypothetical protein
VQKENWRGKGTAICMRTIRRFLRRLPRLDLKNSVVLLALVPTAYAVFTGLTMTPTWPMPAWIAIPGAASLLLVSVAVGNYISRVSEFNKSLKRYDNYVHPIPSWYGWTLLGLTTTAEVTLALLVNIIPGVRTYSVIAFPMLGLAGVFVYSLRMALTEAVELREDGRKEAEKKKNERRKEKLNAPKAPKDAPVMLAPIPVILEWKKECPVCKEPFTDQHKYSSHIRWSHPKKEAENV